MITLTPRESAALLRRYVAVRALGDGPADKLHALGDALGVPSRDETPLHRAADAHVAPLSVAVRYAFAIGRRVLKDELLKLEGSK